MAYIKIQGRVRAEIMRSLEGKFNARKKVHVEAINAMGNELYNALFPPELQAALAKIPKEFIYHGEQINFDSGNGRRYAMPLGYARPMPLTANYHYFKAERIPRDSRFWKEFEIQNAELSKLHEEEQMLYKSIEPVLDSCASLQSLVKVWPSALEYVAPHTLRQFREHEEWKAKLSTLPKEERKRAARRPVVELDDTAKHLLTKTKLLHVVNTEKQ